MKFHIRFAEQIAGLFVLIALVMVLAIIIFMGINQRWFSKDYYFTSKFASGNGLSVGMPLKLRGFKIGTVDKIELNTDNTVEANFHIFDTYYSKVTKNSVLELSVSPIGIGGSGLRFYPGKSHDLIADNSYIPSLDFNEGKNLVAKGLVNKPPTNDTILNIINEIGPLLKNANNAVISLNELLITTNDTLKGNSSGPVGDIIKKINTLIAQIDTILSDASGKINTILGNTSGITANLRTTSKGLTDTKGLITHLLDPKGSISRLLNDNFELYNQINGILSGVKMTTDELQTFTGYINNRRPQISELLEGSREALQKGKDVLDALRNNPLLKGGIPGEVKQPTTFRGYREEEF